MTIAPEGLGFQVDKVWMGPPDGLVGTTLPSWVPACVVYLHGDHTGAHLVYPLNKDQATAMRDRLVALGGKEQKRPVTAGERYLASKKTNEAKFGLTLKFDDEADGIFVADREASPAGLMPTAAASISFKAARLNGVIECNQFTAEECALFGKTLTEVLDRFVEPE